MSVYKPGEGCDETKAQGWFDEKTKEKSGENPNEESEGMSPPRKQNEIKKHNENMLVLKSITKIRLCKDNKGPKNYQIKCDYEMAFKATKSLCDRLF